MQRQAAQGLQVRLQGHSVIKVDIDLVVVLEELPHVAAIGQSRYGKTDAVGVQTQFGGALPVRINLQQRLRQAKAGGLGLD